METLDFLKSDGSLGVGFPASQGFNPASDLVKGCLLVVRMAPRLPIMGRP